MSNDNPFSEALFRTLKVHPSYPVRWFRSLEAVIAWVRQFVAWYNNEHRHSGIKYVTPSQRHHGLADAICEVRRRTYEKAYRLHPARWSRHQRCWKQPDIVWINHPRPAEHRVA
ncbi:integrase core domain-containing protein [Synechococcus sp. RSCCF101]|uniref:integrase core domain-containing protein n=1 Tax=Synechococcus sp. RSCCF101 TaxID=2511069 RepID=UPI00177BF9AF